MLSRQLAEGASLMSGGASRKTLADAKTRWEQEREDAGLDADGNPMRSGNEHG